MGNRALECRHCGKRMTAWEKAGRQALRRLTRRQHREKIRTSREVPCPGNRDKRPFAEMPSFGAGCRPAGELPIPASSLAYSAPALLPAIASVASQDWSARHALDATMAGM